MILAPTPLPRPNPYHPGILHEAYARCLDLEHNFTHVQETSDVILDPPLAARILGYLLREIPADTGRNSLAQEVNGCATDEEMRALAQFYVHNFILAFQSNFDGISRDLSDELCGLLFDEERTDRATSEASTLTHSEAKMHALIRDRYRCHITGAYDDMLSGDNELSSWFQANRRTIKLIETEAARIIPEPTSKDMFARKGVKDEREWAATIWAVLSRFSDDPDLPKDLDGRGIHRLENIITMAPTFHRIFDTLKVWLEGTPVLNQYIIRSIWDDITPGEESSTFVFSSSDPTLPVPSPTYLALRATCAKVAHLSGAREYVESMWRAIGDAQVLSTDGSSSTLLSFALNRAATAL